MTKKKIAVVLRTIGLEYDDRVRKECLALKEHFDIHIFVTLESNVASKGVTSYGIPYTAFTLSSRKVFSSGRFLLLKALDFYLQVRPHLKSFDYLWSHEEYTFLFPLLGKRNKFIWDLHELPGFFKKPFLRNIFKWIENRSLYFLHANPYRIEHLLQMGQIAHAHKHLSLRNYPDDGFIISKALPHNFESFRSWLGNDAYVYLQGLTVADRYPYQSIAAVLNRTEFKIVVVGTFEDVDAKKQLEITYANLNDRVFFAGRVDQLAIPAYLNEAKFSIVLYDTDDPNNYYCEANRFFQAINFGIPVIVGKNKSMADDLLSVKAGIVLADDGRDLANVEQGVDDLMSNFEFYKTNALAAKDSFTWQRNSTTLTKIIEQLK